MKKIVFDTNPLGNFLLSAEAYQLYFKRKYNRQIFFYARKEEGYQKIIDTLELRQMKNRVITYLDLGNYVSKIPFSKEIRVPPIDESYENDQILIDVVAQLGELASWKDSSLEVVMVEE
ncbi:MAG: hypothetical protein Q4P25_00850 [Tissierellia bacterium]|nr:hypothetical protein [Tissierellia bacterium]